MYIAITVQSPLSDYEMRLLGEWCALCHFKTCLINGKALSVEEMTKENTWDEVWEKLDAEKEQSSNED